jgi:hypothetical protein
VSPPFSVGTRVTLSDLLFFKTYGALPVTVEDAAPHALTTERVMSNAKLGVYWESYGTDPNGEKMKFSVTVLKEEGRATPVIVSAEDISARGTKMSPRAIELDISTLKKGAYIVQLEVEVAGQYTVRAEHRIEIIGP